MRWLWADWGGRDRAQQTPATQQAPQRGTPSGRLKTGKLGRARGRTQTRPRVALAAQAAASATGPLGRAFGASGAPGQASLGSAYADTDAMTFFAPAVAPASTVAAMYWEAGRNTWESWEPRADVQRNWPGAGYSVAGDGAHNDLRDNGHGTMMRQRSAMTAASAMAPATAERRAQSAGAASGAAKASRRARHGLTSTLLRATAQAAEALGRAPEEVWAEALNIWLASQEALAEAVAAVDDGQPTRAATSGHARPIEVRRQETWSEIDATLSALRAS